MFCLKEKFSNLWKLVDTAFTNAEIADLEMRRDTAVAGFLDLSNTFYNSADPFDASFLPDVHLVPFENDEVKEAYIATIDARLEEIALKNAFV